jgi:hypothetical protein
VFINTTLGTFFDPVQYPGRLLVCLNTDDRPECGVFSGTDCNFDAGDKKQRMQTIEHPEFSGEGLEVFEIVRHPRAPLNQIRQYHYGAISWKYGGYLSYPTGQELVLTEHNSSEEHFWTVHFAGVQVLLPDYGT